MKLLLLLFFTALAALAQPATAITINQTRANGGIVGDCLLVNPNLTVGQSANCGGGGGPGTVTNVSGTTGQITVVNPTTTPVVSLTNNTTIPGSPTTTTQAPGDSSTKVATTAFVTGAISTACALAGDVTGNCGANTVIGVQTSATLPVTCAIGDVYSLTTGTQGFYTCGPTANNWTYAGPSITPNDQIGNHLLTGCGVEYVSGLNFTVGACTYVINNVTYTSAVTNITLTAASMTDARIDVILVDSTGIATKITGTANTPPSEPSIDPSTQIGLVFVTIAANGMTPSGIVNTPLYLENTEWTCASSANINCASTTNPYQGTKDIEATAAVLTNNFTLVKPASGTIDLSTQNSLVFYIRSKAKWPSANGNGGSGRRTLTLTWLSGATAVGVGVVIADGAFGFNSDITTSYQQISIPIALFGTGSTTVTTLKATVSGNGGTSSFGWYIDDVTLQSGTGQIILPTTLMNWQGTWNSTKSYVPNDVVVSNGFTYVALVANTNVALTTVATWKPAVGDNNNNISTPGSVSTGVGSANAGIVALSGGTQSTAVAPANSTGFIAPASVTGQHFYQPPGTASAAHQVWIWGAESSAVGVAAFKTIPDCQTGALSYTQSTDAFGCNAIGGTGAITLIAETPVSGTNVVTFSSLGSFRDLIVIVRGRSTASATSDDVLVTFNTDTTAANYDFGQVQGANNSLGTTGFVALGNCPMMSLVGNTAPANEGSGGEFKILDYRGTTFQKFLEGIQGVRTSTTAASITTAVRTCYWHDTAAITRIDVTLTTGNYTSGSVVSLYGSL